MSEPRPTVAPDVVSTAIEGAPDRVRRRLDRTPAAAAAWEWNADAAGWTIAAGSEVVTLPAGHVASLQQVRCSCLLAPNCFHVMACLTALEVVAADAQATPVDQHAAPRDVSDDDAERILLSELQLEAADELANSIKRLMNVGITGAGVAVQSGLMRAVHQSRACGLHRAAAVGLRVIEGTRQVRRSAAVADPVQLAQDIADCLETTQHLATGHSVQSFWVGTARRKQHAIKPKRLHGLCAEPILTRSGFAGVAVYLLGEDDRIYTVSEVRPGGAELCRSAYRGGIDIGPLVVPAAKLARGQYLGSDLTASRDGRLGRGKSVKIASQGAADWNSSAVQQRFSTNLTDQCDRVFGQTSLPPDLRPAGWDFVFFAGSVLGAVGAELLLKLEDGESVVRLAITNDHEDLSFRENLRMLSHAPGLDIKLIGRLDLTQPATVEPLALSVMDSAPGGGENDRLPRLDLPDELAGRVNLGLDPIPRHSFIDAQLKPFVLGDIPRGQELDLLAPLRRRWIAMMLGGTSSLHRGVTNTIAGEIARLHRTGFATGAALLDAMSRPELAGSESFLATAVYLRRCSSELARAQTSLS